MALDVEVNSWQTGKIVKWIGLTGGIASGKSTVTKILREQGLPVIDADVLAHQAVGPGSPALQQIVEKFGADILQTDQSLDRKKLAERVFGNSADLRALEAIVHPEVRRLMTEAKQRLEQAGEVLAFYDVPLLSEKNMQSEFDSVVVVTCTPEQQVARLMSRDGLSAAQAEQRLRSQKPLASKAAVADYVLVNSDSEARLRSKVESLVQNLLAR